jgi:hypothetical protein
MEQALIDRYQNGGDIYAQLADQYGIDGADIVAEAALTGDRTKVTSALTQIKYGANLNDSTWSIFGNQLATDPLAAPLASANNVIGNSFMSLLKNPWVVGAVALGLFIALGGFDFLKRQIAKK